jgi:hypothetical protein
MKYYLLVMWSDVEPRLIGPYKSAELRDDDAKKRYAKDGGRSGFYRVNSEGRMCISAFSNKEMEA